MKKLMNFEAKIMDPACRPTWDEAVFAFYNYDYVNYRFDPNHEPSYDSAFSLFREDIKASAQIFKVLYRSLSFVLPFDQPYYDEIKNQIKSGFVREKYYTSASHSVAKAYEVAAFWLDNFERFHLAGENNIVIMMLIIEDAKAKDIPFTDLEEVIMQPGIFHVLDISTSFEYLPLRDLRYKLEICTMEAFTKERRKTHARW